ncbi:MAG: hypothetical protein ABJA79_00665 [Parafilimonas sp.]
MKKIFILLLTAHCSLFTAHCQDMTELVNKVRAKLEQVNDYTADGILKTNVVFIKAPISKIKVYYKRPNKFRMKKEGGISILPKGGVSINLDNVVAMKDFAALNAGESVVDGFKTRIVKLLPVDENSDIVLSTLYIDEANTLVRKAITTTKENGTYEITMTYGKYSNYGLPDKVVFSFNAKDYKLPKGITLEMDEGKKSSDLDKLKNKKGKVEITYKSYSINKGIDDAVFK